MKLVEIRELSIDDISKKIDNFKHELFNLRFQNEINQLEGSHRIQYLRKSIARLKTISREKELNSLKMDEMA